MPRELSADFTETFLFPPCVEDWVGPDHPARFIRAFVESLDLADLGVDWNESPDGRPSYSAALLMMVWLYGYFIKERSTRRLEAACREQMGLVWLAGRHTPDHNTLWRFFSRNKAALRGLFKHSVKVAMRSDMVGMVLHALDGTKIRAKAKTGKRMQREELEQLLCELDSIVSDWERHIEDTAAPDEPGTGIPEHLHNEARLREKVREALAELANEETDKVHPDDPQARVMKCSDIQGKRLAYNSQAVVDAKCGILVAQVVNNQAFDQHLLTPMLDAVEQTVGACAQTTLADAGYATGEALRDAQNMGRDVLVNLPSRIKGVSDKPYHASHFDYDPEIDTVTCPRGQTLEYKHTRTHKNKGYDLRLFRCMNKECPVRSQCTKERKGRSIELGPYHDAITRQKRRQADEGQRRLLKRRGGLIESVFGTIKSTYQFNRYTRHGLENVQTEWALICTTVNLKKLYQRWKAQRPNPAGAAQPIPA
jgi:transposase